MRKRVNQNNPIKVDLEEALYEGEQGFHSKKYEKLQNKCGQKDAFDVAANGSLDDAIKGTPLNLKFDSFLCRAEQTELLTFSN